MSEFRNYFNYPDSLLFFNSGSMSLSPRSVIDATTREKERYELNPTAGLFGAWERLWAVQKELATFFDCRAQDLYLRPNVTYAMNDFLMALRLPEGSEILVSDLEYGAIVKICEHKAHLENLSLRTVSLYDPRLPHAANSDAIVQNLKRALSKKTKLVVLSHIMTGTGLKIPISKIGQMLRESGVFFAVDGAHGAGIEDLELDENLIDFYGTNLHKWLMGPKATGFGWVAPHMRPHLEPRFAGWTTGTIAPYFESFGEGDAWSLRWMLCSTLNFADFNAIPAALSFWRELGAQRIRNYQIAYLNELKKTIADATGWQLISDYPPELCGPLVSFRLPSKLQRPTLMAEFEQNHNLIIATPMVRSELALRFSPNIYNTKSELEQLATILGTSS